MENNFHNLLFPSSYPAYVPRKIPIDRRHRNWSVYQMRRDAKRPSAGGKRLYAPVTEYVCIRFVWQVARLITWSTDLGRPRLEFVWQQLTTLVPW